MSRRDVDPLRGKRFCGNKNTMEVHDLDNEDLKAPGCQIDEIIRAGHAIAFSPDSLIQAHRLGYKYCIYCIRGITIFLSKVKSLFRNRVFLSIICAILGTAVALFTQELINKHILGKNITKLWSVTGRLILEGEDNFEVKRTLLSIKPPEQDIYGDGQFIVWKVPIETGGEKKPSLLIKKDGYKIIEIVLEERPPEHYEKYALPNYLIKYNKKKKLIEIKKQIILERERVPGQGR
jgi:hypothetical protein